MLEPYVTSKPARSYANGTLTFAPDFASDAILQSFVATENVRYANRSLLPARDGRPGVVLANWTSKPRKITMTDERLGRQPIVHGSGAKLTTPSTSS